MGLQNLAIIFIIIVLPMTLILTSYTQSQIDTLDLQIKYDIRLRNATYDALKAFQINSINNNTSDISNSKLRDIDASINVFFNSIATNFNMDGYNKDILKEYVPALVYTMYDGYYIYSPYINKLDTTKSNEVVNDTTKEVELKSDAEIFEPGNEEATYHENEKIYGLKPYIYYSCRYYYSDNFNFVITYSLDNYITIQGTINGKWVNDSGYLLDNIEKIASNKLTYRGIEITPDDTMYENVYDPEKKQIVNYQVAKVNGVKYYKDGRTWFSILRDKKYPQNDFTPQTSTALQYYKDAYNFKQKILNKEYTDFDGNRKNDGYGIGMIRGEFACDEEGKILYELDEEGNSTSKFKFTGKIFDFRDGGDANKPSIEDPNSEFNQNRLAVIRYCIEKELSIAIANYNNYTSSYTNFQMPKLDEAEWERIINNVSMISFLQGLSIGGKIYNGYSIITNNKNKEVVNENSIYILATDRQYHRADCKDLRGLLNVEKGVLDLDFEIKTAETDEGNKYYIPQGDAFSPVTGCYSCIVSNTNIEAPESMYKYMEDIVKQHPTRYTLAQKYFTALARERYAMYRTNNK